MGNYCNKLPDGTELHGRGKAEALAQIPWARELNHLPTVASLPSDKVLVVVVDNGPFSFEAALVCDTEKARNRVERAKQMGDKRVTRFFLLNRSDVEKMADQPLEA